jgi:hypothetical protein
MNQMLPFISDEDLIQYTKQMVSAVERSKISVEKNPYRGVADPFSALVDASVQGITFAEWLEQEKARKIQKSLQNALGDFHQNILGSVHGWANAGPGGSYDVRNEEKKIIAEVKNKYNTLNSEGFISVYNKLSNHLDFGSPGFTAYYVAIVPKGAKSYDEPFTPVKKKVPMPLRQDLRKIDGKSFYALATGYDNALDMLYGILPAVLKGLGCELAPTESGHFINLFDKAFNQK